MSLASTPRSSSSFAHDKQEDESALIAERLFEKADAPRKPAEGRAEEVAASSKTTNSDSMERRMRMARVMDKQQKRISAHIQQFCKLSVSIIGTDIVFDVTISRTEKVEGLARLIEAEYAYKCFYKGAGQTSLEMGGEAVPLQIGQMYNAGRLALRFNDLVGDVLGYTDRVSVINAFEGPSLQRSLVPPEDDPSTGTNDMVEISSLTKPHSHSEDSEGLAAGVYRRATSSSSRDRDAPSNDTLSRNPSASLDNRLQPYLRNEMALRYFAEFCFEEYTLEILLFWIDAEVYQACGEAQRRGFAKYMYLNYVERTSPLQVNLTPDLCRELEQLIKSGKLDSTTFDEAQEQAYAMIKNHSFVKFEGSKLHSECLQAKKADNAAYQKGRLTEPFIRHFATSPIEAQAMLPLLERMVTPTENDRKLSSTSQNTNIGFRENMLDRVIARYLPYFDRSIEGYFSEGNRNRWSSKQARMHKEKKLAKFFGERPSVDLVQQQIALASANYLREAMKGFPNESPHDLFGAAQSPNEEEITYVDFQRQMIRRRKKEKLEEFFGNRLPDRQKRNQRLMVSGKAFGSGDLSLGTSSDDDSSEGGSYETLPPGPTENELDPEERRILQKRTKKISRMLGEAMNEQTISQRVTHAAKLQSFNSQQEIPQLPPITTSSFSLGDPYWQQPADAQDSDSKFMHKKRLDKISQLMGERIGVSDLEEAQNQASGAPSLAGPGPNRPLTSEEKRQFQWKASKLERVLGQLPPVEALMRSLPAEQKTEVATLHRGLVGLSFLVRNANALELLDTLSEITQGGADAPPGELSFTGSSDTTPDGSKDPRKRQGQEKLKKLRRFFGDNVTVEKILETQILADVERSLQDLQTSPHERNLLRAEVDSIRSELRRRSDEFSGELQ
ncbi:uncharacterized protein EV422DRAFT_544041 [Fimicolochytrium jonesii]|uniref:uncharacterized protein n=1 Tax=Fimicolochytrium jonesii TaxID=1396493 RepID=UPI0022FE21E8|nr:uncharacterized protein EV422DRAFT_544041 [Fimicolochytrium jonesii]KAI8816806.1 hypothetical protein EV422DRAFT_544041 [Fimicolochytrium jonesii]